MKINCRKINLVFIAALSVALSSCHDHRLENKTFDISRGWYLAKYELNNGDSTLYYGTIISGYNITFTEAGTYSESYLYFGVPVASNGFYYFQDNLAQLVISDEDTTRVYDIIELSPQHLTIELVNTPDDKDVFFLEPL